jgi:hypothetical protein
MNKRMFLSGTAMLLGACSEGKPKKRLKIAGGGLVFNYRYSQANIVIVAQTTSELPEGGMVEAMFDKPGTTERERVSVPVIAGKLAYKLECSPMLGIKKDEVYKVTLRLVDAKGIELERQEAQFKSDQDQSTLPSKPLVDPSKPNYVPQLENLQ